MGNLSIYDRYKEPPKDAQKAFNNGRFKGTDINPMWRIRSLTECFGPCGKGWYTETVRWWREDTPDGVVTVYCHLNLYVKHEGESDWSAPIEGIGGNTLTAKTKNGVSTTDEAYKMAYTDALGIACKALGFGADIWWKSNDSKYTAYQDDEPEPKTEAQPPLKPFTPPQQAAQSTVTVSKPYDFKPHLDAFCKAYNISAKQFAEYRQKLIAGGAIEDKPSATMAEDDWQTLFNVIATTFLGESA